MTDSTARNIVSQLGDLYMDFTHPATTDRAEFVKYRQTTNDQADAFVEALLREYGAAVLDEEADVWSRGAWADAPRHADRVQERIANGRHVGEWLRDRAARRRAVAECPICGSTTPGGTPSCDCDAHRDVPSTETGEADPCLLLILLGGILGALVVAGVLAFAGVLG